MKIKDCANALSRCLVVFFLVWTTSCNRPSSSDSSVKAVASIPVAPEPTAPPQTTAYDLLVKGGHVIDPAHQIDALLDVAVKDGKIALIQANIDPALSLKLVDAQGLMVLPGLIDIHAHVFIGTDSKTSLRDSFLSISPDSFSFRTGVTTMVDAGSSGWRTFDKFRSQIIAHSSTRVFAFLNILGEGMWGEETDQQDLNDMSVEKTAEMALKNRDVIVGVKLAHFYGDSFEPAIRAVEVGKRAEIPVMIDFGRHQPPLSLDKLFMEVLRPGDIFTHMYGNTPGRMTVVDEHGKLQDFASRARAKGISFDVGHGGGSFAFSQAAPAVRQGFAPDTISTDFHTGSMNSAMRDILNVMGKMMSLGVKLNDAIAMVTSRAAKSIHHSELGHLGVGATADIAILRSRNEPAGFLDTEGRRVDGQQTLECEMTLMGGKVMYDRNARAGVY